GVFEQLAKDSLGATFGLGSRAVALLRTCGRRRLLRLRIRREQLDRVRFGDFVAVADSSPGESDPTPRRPTLGFAVEHNLGKGGGKSAPHNRPQALTAGTDFDVSPQVFELVE